MHPHASYCPRLIGTIASVSVKVYSCTVMTRKSLRDNPVLRSSHNSTKRAKVDAFGLPNTVNVVRYIHIDGPVQPIYLDTLRLVLKLKHPVK